LELLIDGYTPFFKANIEMLPTVERKVFVTLAEIWAPATAAQVADRARMNSSKVSAILGRLVRRGAVAVVDQDQGKQRYELTERLYNLYHLLRRPESEGRVRALVDILTHLYDPGRLEREVFPKILRPQAETPLSDLDLRIASRLECHIDEAGVWDDLTPAECDARLAMLQSLLEDQQASLGDDHPDTLLTRHQVADFTGQTGNARAAVDLFRQVAADRELVLGPDHPHTLTSRHGLAHYLGETGDARAALDLYRQVAADSERVLGPAHPHTLISRHQVARYLGETGDAQAALHTAEQVLRSAESLPANNAFLQAIRGLRDLLELRVKRDASKPLPRELREVLEAIDRREHQRAGEPPVSRGRPRRREGGGGRGPLRRGR
ncbi:MAG TPA: tetratricopeptide repeat protein, partial [Actinomycetota bacterium]